MRRAAGLFQLFVGSGDAGAALPLPKHAAKALVGCAVGGVLQEGIPLVLCAAPGSVQSVVLLDPSTGVLLACHPLPLDDSAPAAAVQSFLGLPPQLQDHTGNQSKGLQDRP